MSRMPELACFYDIETSGTDEEVDEILEVGAVLYNIREDVVVSENDLVISWSKEASDRISDNPVVLEMHTKSGLLTESHHYYAVEVADARLSAWLDNGGGKKAHVVSAGSGVAHFDRRFLKRYLPQFDRRMTYWSLDVGVLRRACEIANPELVYPATGEIKTHRALADARLHLQEWRHYRSILAGAMPPVPDNALEAQWLDVAASISDAEQREVDAFERASLEAWTANENDPHPRKEDSSG